MLQLRNSLLEAQTWCDHKGDHNTGFVSLSVDTLQAWYNMAFISVIDLLEIADLPNYIVLTDGTNELQLSSDMELNQNKTVEELEQVLAAPVYRFGISNTVAGHLLQIYI